ncbi:MAG: glycosyltransferase [Holophagales bacterium]|nr:glycosyltransferase [Holophagales bacterium]
MCSPPQPDSPADDARPRVSAIIAAYNAEATIVACVDSLLAQSHRPVEILVADDGSTDATAELLEAHPRRSEFQLLRLENGGPSRARNLGAAHARGDYLAFFDSDCRVDESCVEALLEGFDGDDVASVGGAQRSPADESPFGLEVQRYFETVGFLTGYLQQGEAGSIVDTAHNPSCNVIYRRRAFDAAGGFDERLWPGEDVDLDHRLHRIGYRHRFNPEAVIEHYRPASLAAFRRMMGSYGRAQGILLRRYGPFRLLHALPLLAAAALLAAALGLAARPRTTALVLTCGLTLAVTLLELGRRRASTGPGFYTLLASNLECWSRGFVDGLRR